ncbi:M1 family aminopeptidase [Thermococcus gorgonarius]|uniref:Peptidase M1 membrane alanine aminopeptidase domain-containing protein n=1 Tax=Thermococcus gorgonarius TaxID=71997 RepID=A0A2Z2MAG7_THEGO|nr:M1 family aminopeptidase [Thermococcus gorgonarius]ASJ01542.1 hypothetical protein A3K92_08645 [Thermococcus gorgonarius]
MENERHIFFLTSRDIGFGTDFSWWEFASRNVSIRVVPEFPKDTVFVLFYGGIIRSGMEVTYSDNSYPHGGFTLYLQNMEWKGFEWGGINFTVYFTPDIYSDEGFELIKEELIFAMDLYRNMIGILPTTKFDAMFYPDFSQAMAKRLGTKAFALNFGHVIIINCPADMEDSATNYASFIFHEVAHEWAGPYISLDLDVHRLVEPLATFMQMEAYGKWEPDGYLRWLNDKEYTTLRYGNMRTFYESLGPTDKYTVYVLYYRGAFTLRSLRFVLGEENFSKVFRGIFEKFHTTQCKNITMFEDTIEELSGKDLDWFFSEWFNSTLYPDYNVTDLSLTRGADGYILTFTVTDASNFTMPVPVRVYSRTGASETTGSG